MTTNYLRLVQNQDSTVNIIAPAGFEQESVTNVPYEYAKRKAEEACDALEEDTGLDWDVRDETSLHKSMRRRAFEAQGESPDDEDTQVTTSSPK